MYHSENKKNNYVQCEIRRLALNQANARAAKVEKHKDGVQMFNAMKQLIPRCISAMYY